VHQLTSEGRLASALALVDELLASAPNDAVLVLARASTLFEWGRYYEALPWFRRAEALGAGEFQLFLCAGWTCIWSVSSAAGEPWMRKAANADDREWTGHFGLATSLRGQGKIEEAIAAFERSLEVAPGNLHCMAQLSDCMLSLNRTDAAEEYARQAIAADGAFPTAWTNLGVALVAQDRFDEATAAFEHAEQLAEAAGKDSDPYLNLANCLRETGRLQEALALYERKLSAFSPVSVYTHYAHTLLSAGRLREGFDQYEFRWLHQPLLSLRPSFRKPVWTGQDLRGKTILLRTEQGIGDVIQFIRYVPYVKSLGATVLMQVRPGVGELARCFPGVDRILKADETYPAFDFYAHLVSLARVFGTDVDHVPKAIPYLDVEPVRRSRWANRLGSESTALRVALAWAGDANHRHDRHRSISLRTLAPLASVEGVQFYSLQVGSAAAQSVKPPTDMRLIDLGPELDDFADTAAAIGHMDLVISVDTSVAHLAGALGKPTWTLIATPGDWRWMVGRDDTPWYPTMRLFRQSRAGDWGDVIERVTDALAALVQRRRSTATRDFTANMMTPPSGVVPPIENKPYQVKRHTAPAETAMGVVQYFPEQPFVGRSIELYGEYLRAQTDLLSRLIKPGAIVLEVGAGIGAHVLSLASAVGHAGHFFLYESRPKYQRVLRQNLAANGIGNVTIMKRALRGHMAPVENDAADNGSGNGSGVSITPAPTETIDELRLDALHWLKIGESSDTREVLEGAADSLWRLRPSVFVSVSHGNGTSNSASRLRDFGYQCWKMQVPYFDPGNFNRLDTDVFGGRNAIAFLAIPEEVDVDIVLDRCTRIE
jgi:tetratricopeptide (TPR) repeat protein